MPHCENYSERAGDEIPNHRHDMEPAPSCKEVGVKSLQRRDTDSVFFDQAVLDGKILPIPHPQRLTKAENNASLA